MPAATPLGEPSQRLHGRPSAARGQRFHLAQPVMAQAQSLPQAMLPHHDSPLTVHALYDHHNAANLSSLTVPHHPAPQMIAFQPPSAPWHHPVHIISSNPYPAPSGPQQNTHKVWILECRSCGTFLTNRGMKVRNSLSSSGTLSGTFYLTGSPPPPTRRLSLLYRRSPRQLFRLLQSRDPPSFFRLSPTYISACFTHM